MRLSSCSGAEEAVESLLLSVGGDDLSELKSMQDGFGDIHSMHKLVFQDVTNRDIRERVLIHFLAEGTSQVAVRALMGSKHFVELFQQSERHDCVPESLRFLQQAHIQRSPSGDCVGPSYAGRCGHSWLKILADVDDTLYCSGNRWPSGIDR